MLPKVASSSSLTKNERTIAKNPTRKRRGRGDADFIEIDGPRRETSVEARLKMARERREGKKAMRRLGMVMEKFSL